MYKFLLSLLNSKAKKTAMLMLILVSFGAAVMMIPSEIVLAKMLPGKNNDTFTITIDLPNGSSIIETEMLSSCVVTSLQQEKEVTNIETFLGTGAPLDFAGLIKGSHLKNSENVAEIVVNLIKGHHRTENSFYMVQRLRPLITESCAKLKHGTSIKFVEPPAGPPVLAALVLEVYGDDSVVLRDIALKVESIFKKTAGLVDVDIMQDEEYEKYEIVVNSEKITKSGLDIKQVNDILYLAFEGTAVAVKNSQLYDDQIALFVTLQNSSKIFEDNSKKAVLNKLSSIRLMNQRGMMVPLTEVVSVEKTTSNPMIISKNLRQMTAVLAETDMVSQVYPLIDARSEMMELFEDEYEVSTEGLFNLRLVSKKDGARYVLNFDGEMEVTIKTFIDLGAAFIAALILIFLLMVVYYKSFALSGIVLLGSFISIVGVIIGHWIMTMINGETFYLTATSLIGFIALIGISSRNSLLLIDFAKSLINDKGLEKRDAIAFATTTRSKPIFLTAAAIILASMLLVGDAVFGGLGVALIFGTLTAVMASLILVPILLDSSDLSEPSK